MIGGLIEGPWNKQEGDLNVVDIISKGGRDSSSLSFNLPIDIHNRIISTPFLSPRQEKVYSFQSTLIIRVFHCLLQFPGLDIS